MAKKKWFLVVRPDLTKRGRSELVHAEDEDTAIEVAHKRYITNMEEFEEIETIREDLMLVYFIDYEHMKKIEEGTAIKGSDE